MKKIIILLSILVLLSGCSVNYNIEYDDYKFKETIGINIYATETSKINDLNNLELYVSTKDQIKYQKEISTSDDITTAKFSHTYNGINYRSSRIFKQCYDVYGVREDEDYYYIKTAGEFKCMEVDYIPIDEVKIIFKTDYKVIENNADIVDNNTYTWIVNNSNSKDKPIIISVSKEEKVNNESSFALNDLTIIVLAFLLMAFLGYLILSYISKRKDRI